MEGAPGLVKVMGLGVGQIQLVKVRSEVNYECVYLVL